MKYQKKAVANYIADQLQAGQNKTELVSHIAALLVSERRSKELTALMRAVEQELTFRGTTQVVITSARPLLESQKQELARLLGVSKPVFHEIIDQTVLGGVKASTAEKQVDVTLTNRLKVLKHNVTMEA